MNKTVSINLGGLFFHIDENAYHKLNNYFDAIRNSLSPNGKDEIMNDIESRIAELLSEKLKSEKQVVGIYEVEEIIEIMGQPEDYRLDDDEPAQKSTGYYPPGYNPIRTKKFYRDGDRAIIGGVCAGLSHYFRIDPLWVRIIFIISPFISFGTSVVIYILLWILIPKAITTTEKLEMTGEPINISNIERKVREEFDTLSSKIQSVDYNKLGTNARQGATKIGDGFSKAFMTLFKVIAKIIGAVITLFAALGLVGMIIVFFITLFTSSIPAPPWYPYADGFNYTDTPIWIMGILILLAVAIPLFALFLLGLKILAENMRSIGTTAKYTLLVVWLAAIAGLAYIGVAEANEISAEGKTLIREDIAMSRSDTLNLKFKYNSYFDKSWETGSGFRITQDNAGNNIFYSNNIALYILRTDEAQPYIQIEKLSLGSSISEARKRAEYIKYNFEIQGNSVILDNYFTTETNHKYRNQRVELFLYLPQGTYFRPDGSVKHYDDTDNSFFDLWFDSENLYRMDKNNVSCITCETREEREWGEYEEGPEQQEDEEINELPERIERPERVERPERI